MPIIKSAIKRAKQTIKRRERNVGIKNDIKNATKAFIAKPSSAGLSTAQSEIDTAVKKGLIKKNTAARRKSQLHSIAKKAGVKLSAASSAIRRKVAAKPPTKTAAKPAVKKAVAKSAVQRTVAKKTSGKSAVQRTATKKVSK